MKEETMNRLQAITGMNIREKDKEKVTISLLGKHITSFEQDGGMVIHLKPMSWLEGTLKNHKGE